MDQHDVRQEFDPIAVINSLIQDTVAERLPQVPAPQAGSIAPIPEPTVYPSTDDTSENTSPRMSNVLADFPKLVGRKRRHSVKGRGEAEPVIRFAIDFLGNPRMGELTDAKWKLLDEALPDIPHRDNIPRRFAQTLFQRYKYAQEKKWSRL